jgi:hypothetical protein
MDGVMVRDGNAGFALKGLEGKRKGGFRALFPNSTCFRGSDWRIKGKKVMEDIRG